MLLSHYRRSRSMGTPRVQNATIGPPERATAVNPAGKTICPYMAAAGPASNVTLAGLIA